MFEKNMKIAYLLDLYGDALDEHIANVMKAYYNDDLSLAEIAFDEGISRQGIRHLIKKGEEKLSFLEGKLGLAARATELDFAFDIITEVRDSLLGDQQTDKGNIEKLNRALEIISKGNQDVR